MPLISQAEYARRRGCTRAAVTKAVSEGRITLIDGKVDPDKADRQWSENGRARADSRPAAQGAKSGTSPTKPPAGEPKKPETGADPVANGLSYAEARARREHAEAQRAEFDLQRMSGRLVDRVKTETAVFDLFRALRDKAFAACPRAARKAASAADVREIELIFNDELRAAFEEFERRAGERLSPEALQA